MPRATPDSITASLLAETNKPRFCYFGYAPPVCIGDNYDKDSSRKNSIHVTKRNILCGAVVGPFSTPSSLYVGDKFQDKWKMRRITPHASEPPAGPSVYKPLGGVAPASPYPVHMRDTADFPDPKSKVQKIREERAHPQPPFIPVDTNARTFNDSYSYMYPFGEQPRGRTPKPNMDPRTTPSFRVNYGRVEPFNPYPPAMSRESTKVSEKNSSCPPFRPCGAAPTGRFDGYMSPVEVRVKKAVTTGPAWRSSPVPVTSSPIPSILSLNVPRE
jgi:hypothetical protein